jgi:hypothetical protein
MSHSTPSDDQVEGNLNILDGRVIHSFREIFRVGPRPKFSHETATLRQSFVQEWQRRVKKTFAR